MNTNGPSLRDIQVPSVSWWPPAIGWWLLAMTVLAAMVAIAAIAIRHRRRMYPRRAARRALAALAERFAQDRDARALAAGLSKLLRRIALAIEPAVAAKDSGAWRAFLEQRAPGAFDDEHLRALLEGPYRAHSVFDAEALLVATRRWCERALRKGTRPAA